MDEQRRELFVKREFQKNMILEVMLITFILINILVIAFFFILDYVPNLHQNKEYIALAIAAFEVIGFIFVYRYNRRASHRIAGPVFSLERSLKSIETGDISFTMDVREDDQFLELRDQLNATVVELRERLESAQLLVSTLQQQPGNRQAVDDLARELSYFKTSGQDLSPEKRMVA